MDIYGNPYAELCQQLLKNAENSDDSLLMIQAANALERLARRIQQLELEKNT